MRVAQFWRAFERSVETFPFKRRLAIVWPLFFVFFRANAMAFVAASR